jgi:hypothetical protein
MKTRCASLVFVLYYKLNGEVFVQEGSPEALQSPMPRSSDEEKEESDAESEGVNVSDEQRLKSDMRDAAGSIPPGWNPSTSLYLNVVLVRRPSSQSADDFFFSCHVAPWCMWSKCPPIPKVPGSIPS